MIRENIMTIPFQTFFVSKEISNCPLTTDIIKFGKKLDEFGILKDGECNISLAFGKRILINAKKVDIENLKQQDIIEIVDYDPIKNVILIIGKKSPGIETPVHWIIQKARHDVNAILQITSKNLYDHLINDFPTTEEKAPKGSIEQAKQILKALRTGKNILIKNEGVLLVGFNLKEIEDSLPKMFEDFQ
jgi:hypothetical protein